MLSIKNVCEFIFLVGGNSKEYYAFFVEITKNTYIWAMVWEKDVQVYAGSKGPDQPVHPVWSGDTAEYINV